jgi:hypothetical protein
MTKRPSAGKKRRKIGTPTAKPVAVSESAKEKPDQQKQQGAHTHNPQYYLPVSPLASRRSRMRLYTSMKKTTTKSAKS